MKLPKLNLLNGVLWCSTGFRLEIQKVSGTNDRFLKVDDLNPQAQIVGRFSRLDTARIGLFFLWRSIFAEQPSA